METLVIIKTTKHAPSDNKTVTITLRNSQRILYTVFSRSVYYNKAECHLHEARLIPILS